MAKSIIILSDYREYRRTKALVVSQSGTNAYERVLFKAFFMAIYKVYGICCAEVNKDLLFGKGPWSYRDYNGQPKVMTFDQMYPQGLADIYLTDPEKEPDWDYRFKCWSGYKRINLPERVASPGIPKLYLLNYYSNDESFNGHWEFLQKHVEEIGRHTELGAVFVDGSTRLKPDDDTIERLRLKTVAAEGGAFCVDLTEKLRIKSPWSYDLASLPPTLGGVKTVKFSSVDELSELMVQQMTE